MAPIFFPSPGAIVGSASRCRGYPAKPRIAAFVDAHDTAQRIAPQELAAGLLAQFAHHDSK